MLDEETGVHYALFMNRLPIARRAQIIQLLVEGASLRSASRVAEVSINTVTKLFLDVADAAHAYHNRAVRDVGCKRVRCDEIWCFVGAKQENARRAEKAGAFGDVWTWTAIDADTKLCIGYLVGERDGWWANEFMQDLANRIRGRVQLTTDAHRAYLEAVQNAFRADIDFATLQKIYGASDEPEKRCSPAKCIGSDMKVISDDPDPSHVSTSFVERRNPTMSMSMRRWTRLTNSFSKKVEKHAAAVALHFIHYNFARIHKTLRITPAMAAGLSDHVWNCEEITGLAE